MVCSLVQKVIWNRTDRGKKKKGNADGLGQIRAEELLKSARKLGVRNDSDVFIVDDAERFPDSMQANWSASDITSVLASAFAPEFDHQEPSSSTSTKSRKRGTKKNTAAPVSTIDALITFDRRGVSNHPNHRSLYHGAVHFLLGLMKDKTGYTCPIALYTLTTTNILRKYLGLLDTPVTMIRGVLHTIMSMWSKDAPQKKSMDKETPGQMMFVSSVSEYLTAQSAMVNAHKSQMVWFRWGWITIGRYMVVNDLRKQRI